MKHKNKHLIIALMVVFSLLFLRLIQLQVSEREKYNLLANENAAKTVSEPAPRGIIYDSFGKVLVENQPSFSIHVLPYVLFNKEKGEQDRILKLLSSLLGQQIDLRVTASEPIIIQENVSKEVAVRIEEQKSRLPGVIVTSRPVRLYPHNSSAAHLLGYVGEIEARELERLKKRGYRLGDVIGKAGVEKIYDQQLRGSAGGKKVEVDVYGTPIRILESLEPKAGADMQLTVDLALQKAAEEALGKQEGAVVVLDVVSGGVLALSSYPNYNPNIFISPAERKKWKALTYAKHPFMNRALAIYPPASIFKVVTLTAALEEGIARPDEIINCNGVYKINQRLAKCWLERGHGAISVKEGLVWSCDVVFYELGRRLGPEILARYASKFGLGLRTGIDLPQEKLGTVPDRSWKRKYLKQPWYAGDSINYSIGQGFLEVTPLQMASMYAALATGKMMKPYLVSKIKNKQGELIYQGSPKVKYHLPISDKNLEIIQQSLRAVVKRGTGVAVRASGLPAAGKTGTAENSGKAHAWFISYAPYDDPKIVVAAFVAHGEHGDKASAYVARDVLRWYRENRLKKEYPQEKFSGQYIIQGGRKVPYRP